MVASTIALAVAALIFLQGAAIEDTELSSALRFTAQTAMVFVSFGVFFVQWLPPKQPKTLQSMFIASAFLAIGFLSFAHILTCAMTSSIFASEAPVGSFFHMMVGVTMGSALLVATFIPGNRTVGRRDSYMILLGFIFYVGAVAAAAMIFGSHFPSLCPHDARADPLRILIEIGVIMIFLLAAVKYYMITRRTMETVAAYLTIATIVGIYTHIAFCLHQNPYDAFSVLSAALTIASLGFVFLALFRTSITQPYDSLTSAQEQAERRRKEAEAATVKAQTYLDFLSHDIANMISPIMGRAEMILHSADASERQKEEALKIIDQTQKVASLIVNLRRLSSAERIDVIKLEPVDLRSLLPVLGRARERSYPERNLKVTVILPEDRQVTILGGSASEEIVEAVLDNAIEQSDRQSSEVEICVRPSKGDVRRRFWDIEITDNGPGMSDHVKAVMDINPSDPERRFTRGVASSFSVMPLIAEALGGRIRIENSSSAGQIHGTKVTVTLPRA